jgi:uncharacterized repeat protein (TIGR01451 family)
VQYGHTIDYTIVVSNAGPSQVSQMVTDTLPPELDAVSATWQCIAATTQATCATGGTGNFSDTPTVPAGGSVTYLLSATVLTGASDESIISTATVGSSGDSDSSNNISTSRTTIVIFRDDFDAADGVFSFDTVATLDETATFALDPATAPQAGTFPVEWLRAIDAQEREVFRVEVVGGKEGTLMRVVARDANGVESHSAWTALKSAALGLVGNSGSYKAMLVVSGGAGLELAIPSWAALPLTVDVAN